MSETSPMNQLAAAVLLDAVPDGDRRAVLHLMEAEYQRGLAEGAALHAAAQRKWVLAANPELPTARVTQGRTNTPGTLSAEVERARIERRPGFAPFWCDGAAPGVNLRCGQTAPHPPHDEVVSFVDSCVPCRAHELASTIWWQQPTARRRACAAFGWLLRLTYRVPDELRCDRHKDRKTWTRPLL